MKTFEVLRTKGDYTLLRTPFQGVVAILTKDRPTPVEIEPLSVNGSIEIEGKYFNPILDIDEQIPSQGLFVYTSNRGLYVEDRLIPLVESYCISKVTPRVPLKTIELLKASRQLILLAAIGNNKDIVLSSDSKFFYIYTDRALELIEELGI